MEAGPDLCLGTVDSWLLWNLTGGEVFATEASNASRTMLFDIRTLEWSDELCALFGVPRSALAEVRPTSGRFGVTGADGGLPGRHPHQRHRRRPAGRPLRPGLLRPGHDQEHLRHRVVRAHERGRHLPRAGRRPAHHGGLDPARRRRRRCAPTTPTRAPSSPPGPPSSGSATAWALIDRGRPRSGPLAETVDEHRRRVPRARLHRPGQPVVGPLRPGPAHRHHPGHHPGPPGPGRARGHGPADPRRGRRHDRGQRPRGHRAAGRRRGLRRPPAAALQADQLGVPGPSGRGARDHRPGRRLPGRAGRGGVVLDRRAEPTSGLGDEPGGSPITDRSAADALHDRGWRPWAAPRAWAADEG